MLGIPSGPPLLYQEGESIGNPSNRMVYFLDHLGSSLFKCVYFLLQSDLCLHLLFQIGLDVYPLSFQAVETILKGIRRRAELFSERILGGLNVIELFLDIVT